MVNLREAQDILLHCHAENLKSSFYFMMLPNQLILNFPNGRIHLSILKHFQTMNAMQNLGFSKNNIYRLVDALRIPKTFLSCQT